MGMDMDNTNMQQQQQQQQQHQQVSPPGLATLLEPTAKDNIVKGRGTMVMAREKEE